MKWIIGIFVIIVLYIIIDCVQIMFDAYMEFKETPTEPMEWCNKHGAFRRSNTLPLFPELGGTAANANVCPSCYYEAVWKNPNARLNK